MEISDEKIQELINTLKSSADYDFSGYSAKSFKRRILKVLETYSIDIIELINRVKYDFVFVEQIVKDITVNTTELFRNPKSWHAIKYRILPKLMDNEIINIWHAGCSTGQEVYSMLILLNELKILHKARIYASDINQDVINTAKEGKYVYRFNIEYLENFNKVIRQNPFNFEEHKNVPYSKYLIIDKIEDTITVKNFLKNRVNYVKQNLVKREAIFKTKFDIIFCRNVLIYFKPELQSQMYSYFYDNLKNSGFLVLGYHESILGPQAQKFNRKGLYYTKKLV